MSIKEPHSIKEFRTKEEMEEAAKGNDIQDTNWEGEGYYAVYRYSQRCPRGCCYDSVYETKPLVDHMAELEDHIESLQSSMKYYRDLNSKYDLLAKYTEE